MTKDWDYLIVGQGLAGTLMHFQLSQTGARCLVIDGGLQGSASFTAAGIVNPVTGRRFVKSWMIDTLLPVARSVYQELETLLGKPFMHDLPVIRSLHTPRDRENWLIRTGDPAYQPYLSESADPGVYGMHTEPAYSYGRTLQSMRVDLHELVIAYRQFLVERNELISTRLAYDALQIKEGHLTWQDHRVDTVVFCEGYRAPENPWFNYLPFRGTKGEVLIVRIPDLGADAILKNKIFLVPLGNELYWVGATYERKYDHPETTAAGRQYLRDQLDELLRIPYTVVEHRAAVRPTVKHRRPLLGRHPDIPQLAICNGLGTKGASLGPWSAQILSRHLINAAPLPDEVHIDRYADLRHEKR